MKAKIILLSFLLFFASSVEAATVFETNPSQGTIDIDYPYTGSGLTSRPIDVYNVKVPTDVTFDRVQIQIMPGTVTKQIAGRMFQNGTTWFWSGSCFGNQSCNYDGRTQIKNIGYGSPTRVSTTTVEYVFTSTSTFAENTFFQFNFDGGTPYQDLQLAGTNYEFGSAENSSAFAFSNFIPVLRLCNGACDTNTFQPLPEGTDYPWVRVFSPSTSEILNGETNFSFQINTGTTTAIDKLRVYVNSEIQDLGYFDIPVTTDGISLYNYTFTFPNLTDTVQVIPGLMIGTSTIEIGTVAQYRVSDNTGDLPTIDKAACEFSLFDLTSWWDCTTSLITYLLIPPANTLGTLAWYASASSSPSTGFFASQTTKLQSALTAVNGTSSLTSLDMTIPLSIAGHSTMTIPIISFSGAYDELPTQFALFRLICLATLVIFALSVYVGNVQRAWNIIAFKGMK